MIKGAVQARSGALSPSEPHDEFLELCARSASGQLNKEEQDKLRHHLALCPSCRDARQQYEFIIREALPSLAAEDTAEVDPGPGWSQADAESAFFERLTRDEQPKGNSAESSRGVLPFHRGSAPLISPSTWRHIWTLYAAGILLFCTFGLSAYWLLSRRNPDISKLGSPPPNRQPDGSLANRSSLEEQLSDASHQREIAQGEIAQRDRALADLRRQLERQAGEMHRLQEAQTRLEGDLRSREDSRQELVKQRTDLTQKLEAAQSASNALTQKFDLLAVESAQRSESAKLLESKINDLTRRLQEQGTALQEQSEWLAHDRDIRELMGARDLYIAEVYDVADNGATQKPYGRVFYTKGKSLVFYAYDLDQQAGIKLAKSFQAWGRRGPDRQHSLNLGIFYEDSAAKKRWVLKFDDPKRLAQIDAVFVTVEPNGGSRRPSGQSLLFAYLGVGPNHP